MSTSAAATSSEPIQHPRAKKLPDNSEIDGFTPATPGWVVYYYQPEISRVIGLPVAMWALVTYEIEDKDGDDEVKQEIRHFVVTDSGACTDYMDIHNDNDFLCVLGPMILNHQKVIMQHLAERGLKMEGVEKDGN